LQPLTDEIARTEAFTLLLNELRAINAARKENSLRFIDLGRSFEQKDIAGISSLCHNHHSINLSLFVCFSNLNSIYD